MRTDENGRECSVCGQYKAWVEFNKNPSNSHSFDNRCKECLKVYRQSKVYKQANKERSKRDYADPMGAGIQKERVRVYREKMKREQPEQWKANQRKWMNKWRSKNNDKVRECGKRNMRTWISNPRNRLSSTMSALIRHNLDRGKKENKHWETLVPYTLDELKQHLESLWEPGMTWENHGDWHIDHKIPIISFDPQTDIRIVCALENLRPMWATTREIGGVIYEGNLNRSKF
jgi:hypothetical protein